MEPSLRLDVRGVSKRFGGVTALDNVSLQARSGEVHAICGENGAGKSTLMKILAGAITSYDGEVRLNGRRVHFAGPRDAEDAGISIIHQELNLANDLSAAANIFLGREKTIGGFFLDDRTMEREASEYFERLGAKFSPRTRVRQLRIGDQQMVEIAKALSFDADVLIMDEPTSALADAEVERLFRVVDSLRSQGVTVLYITHKMDEVFRLADRITVMRDGRHVVTDDARSLRPEDVVQLMVGREIAPLELDREAAAGPVVLRVQGLNRPHPTLPGRWQLRDVSFDVHRGEVLGVAGLLGAGRTELLESLFGASPTPVTGRIELLGQPINPRSPRDAIRQGLAMVTEDRKGLGLFDQMSVGSNITMCHLNELSAGPFLRRGKENAVARQSVAQLGIKADGVAAPILSLSGGNQQKCILARWLLTNPKVLLLDEPTRGIDVGAKAEIYTLLRQLARTGMGIIMTSSELPELFAVCDRILVLCEGRKTAEIAHEDATEESIMLAATQFETTSASR